MIPASLDDLARAAYTGSTFHDGPWERLPQANRARWASTVRVVAERAAADPWTFADLDPLDRRILDRLLMGATVTRIAAELGRTPSRIHHRLAETAFAAGCQSRAVLLRRYAEWRNEHERMAA
jgi:hypothetical protein